jgi:hypothetical protein
MAVDHQNKGSVARSGRMERQARETSISETLKNRQIESHRRLKTPRIRLRGVFLRKNFALQHEHSGFLKIID